MPGRRYGILAAAAALIVLASASVEARKSAEERLVGLVTLRLDHGTGTVTAEIAPLVRVRGGRFDDSSPRAGPRGGGCGSVLSAGFPAGAALPRFAAYFRGTKLGEMTPGELAEGEGECAGVCAAPSDFSFRLPRGIRWESGETDRRGGRYPHDVASLVAVSPPVPDRPQRITLTPAQRRRVRGVLLARIRRDFRERGHGRRRERSAELSQVVYLEPRQDGTTFAFATGLVRYANLAIEAETLLLSMKDPARPVVVFSETHRGDQGHGAARYGLIDSLDLDGDGIDELVCRFGDDRRGEIVILKVEVEGLRVVYRGPGDGC